MPAGDLDQHSPAKNARFYVDTSALIPVAMLAAKAAGANIPSLEEQRGEKVVRFATRAKKNTATLLTTMLALEEVANSARGRYRDMAVRRAGFHSWREFKDRDGAAAIAEDANARAAMIHMVKDSVGQMASLGIQLDEVDAKGGSSSALAEVVRKQWFKVIQNQAVDPMDALHICIGVAMGATHFITFDRGWDSVSQIITLR